MLKFNKNENLILEFYFFKNIKLYLMMNSKYKFLLPYYCYY